MYGARGRPVLPPHRAARQERERRARPLRRLLHPPARPADERLADRNPRPLLAVLAGTVRLVEPVSCGVMGWVPPCGGRGQAASVHIRSGGPHREGKCAEAKGRRCVGSHERRPSAPVRRASSAGAPAPPSEGDAVVAGPPARLEGVIGQRHGDDRIGGMPAPEQIVFPDDFTAGALTHLPVVEARQAWEIPPRVLTRIARLPTLPPAVLIFARPHALRCTISFRQATPLIDYFVQLSYFPVWQNDEFRRVLRGFPPFLFVLF